MGLAGHTSINCACKLQPLCQISCHILQLSQLAVRLLNLLYHYHSHPSTYHKLEATGPCCITEAQWILFEVIVRGDTIFVRIHQHILLLYNHSLTILVLPLPVSPPHYPGFPEQTFGFNLPQTIPRKNFDPDHVIHVLKEHKHVVTELTIPYMYTSQVDQSHTVAYQYFGCIFSHTHKYACN